MKIAGSAAVATSLAGCLGDDGRTDLLIATGSEGSGSAAFSSGIARLMDEHSENVSLSVENYPGTAAVLQVMGDGEAELGTADQMESNIAHDALNPVEGLDYSGDSELDHKPQQVFGLFPLWFYWLTMEDYGYDTVEDLEGEDLGTGEVGSAPANLLRLNEAGLTNFESVTMDWTEYPGALRDRRVDSYVGYMLPPEISPGYLEEALSMEGQQILSYSEEQRQNLEDSPLLTPAEVDVSGVYDVEVAGAEEVTCVQATQNFVVSEDVDDEHIYELCDVVFDNLQQIKDFHVLFDAAFSPEESAGRLGEGYPVHGGAAEWYQDNGYWEDRLIDARDV